jgi:hypothetical protein
VALIVLRRPEGDKGASYSRVTVFVIFITDRHGRLRHSRLTALTFPF